jgi:DNA-binding CsgD family transcriptional regulator
MDQLPHSLISRLSDRQKQCLGLVGEGYSSKEIGRKLSLSPSTVDNHVSAALHVLGIDDRRLAARLYAAAGPDAAWSQPSTADPLTSFSMYRLPPVGGSPNKLPFNRRILHIFQIALLGVMTISAIMIIISGMVQLFAD